MQGLKLEFHQDSGIPFYILKQTIEIEECMLEDWPSNKEQNIKSVNGQRHYSIFHHDDLLLIQWQQN